MAKRRRKAPQKTPDRNTSGSRLDTGWVAFGVLAAVVAAVAVALLAGREGTVAPRRTVPDAEVIAAAEQADPRIVAVERRFICPCGRCGGMELVECQCDSPGGALEAKGAIVTLLSQGHDVETVVGLVARDFGGLKAGPARDAHGVEGSNGPAPRLEDRGDDT